MVKRFKPPTDIPAETRGFAERLAEKLGGSPEDFRFAEYRYHNGQLWTTKVGWERLVDGQWREVEWYDLPGGHST